MIFDTHAHYYDEAFDTSSDCRANWINDAFLWNGGMASP